MIEIQTIQIHLFEILKDHHHGKSILLWLKTTPQKDINYSKHHILFPASKEK